MGVKASQRLEAAGERASRYANYIRVLVKSPTIAPIHLWTDYQPKVFDKVNRKLIEQMDREILPAFEGARGICIGGSLRWRFREYLKKAADVIDVDLVAAYPHGNRMVPDYVTSASNLYFAGDSEFGFVCSSHVLEHIPNPIIALKEWLRVIKDDGIVYCAVPDKRFTFDHKRKRTTLQHLVNDYKQNVDPGDLTHLNDYCQNCDYRLTWVDKKTIREQVQAYYTSAISGKTALFQPHHHVFVKDDLAPLLKYVGLDPLLVFLRGETIHAVGRKKKVLISMTAKEFE